MEKVNLPRFNRDLLRPVVQTLRNLRRLLALAWEVDKKVTTGYYLTAGLSAFASALSAIAMKYVIDNLVAIQTNPSSRVVGMILVVLGASFLIELIDKVTRWGLNGVYFDYLFRYKLQNYFTYSFYEKLAGLDIGHFENPQTQTLIANLKTPRLKP